MLCLLYLERKGPIQPSLTTFYEVHLVKVSTLKAKEGKLDNESCSLQCNIALAIHKHSFNASTNSFMPILHVKHVKFNTVRILSTVISALRGGVMHVCSVLRHAWLFATPWTVVHQAPVSMGFSRQEYWSVLPFPGGVKTWLQTCTRNHHQTAYVDTPRRAGSMKVEEGKHTQGRSHVEQVTREV